MHGPTKLGHPRARQRQGYDHPPYRVMPKAKPLPPLERINNLLSYQPETGEFFWKKANSPRVRAGQKAGTLKSSGQGKQYLIIRVDTKEYKAHRLAWYMAKDQDPGGVQIDHIDGNTLNNQISNLRIATCSENQRNTGLRRNNTSGFKGVYSHREKWRAEITLNQQKFHLGTFDTPELAHMAYCKAAAELHGDFARAA